MKLRGAASEIHGVCLRRRGRQVGDLQPLAPRSGLPAICSRVTHSLITPARAGPRRSPLTSPRRAAHRSLRAAGGADLGPQPRWVGRAGTRASPAGSDPFSSRSRCAQAEVRAGATGRAAASLPASPTPDAGPTELWDLMAAIHSSENNKVSIIRIQSSCLHRARRQEGRAQPWR